MCFTTFYCMCGVENGITVVGSSTRTRYSLKVNSRCGDCAMLEEVD
jgi:hypothetical protein